MRWLVELRKWGRRSGQRHGRRTIAPRAIELLEPRTLLSGFAMTPVAVTGDPIPGMPGATFQNRMTMGVFGIGDGSLVSFEAYGSGGGLPSNTHVAFLGQPGSLNVVYKGGDPMPGTTANFADPPAIWVRGSGALSCSAAVAGTSGLWAGMNGLNYIGPGYDAAVSPAGQVAHQVVVTGGAAIYFNNTEAVGPDKLPPEVENNPDLYDLGSYSISAPMGGVNANGYTAVYISVPGKNSADTYSAMRLVGPNGWGPEVLRYDASNWSRGSQDFATGINDAGQVLVRMAIDSSHSKWVIAQNPASPQPVPDFDGNLPGTSQSSNVYYAVLGGGGDIAFRAILNGSYAIWVGQPGAIQLLAKKGDPAPGIPDATFLNIGGWTALNAQGTVAFWADAATPSGGYFTGLWAGTPGHLQRVVASGQYVSVAPGHTVKISYVNTNAGYASSGLSGMSGGEDGRCTYLNAQGLLACAVEWIGADQYDDGGVFVIDLNHPVAGTASVSGRVWNDADKNGIEGATETGVAGAQVSLFSDNQQVGSTVTTDTDGTYSFSGLAAGDYYIQVAAPPLYYFTKTGAGTDSHVDPATGQSAPFALADGQADTSLDAGVIRDQPPQGALGTTSIDIAKPDVPKPDPALPAAYFVNVVYTDDRGVNVASLGSSYLDLRDNSGDLVLQATSARVIDQTNPCRVYFQYLMLSPTWTQADLNDTLLVTVQGGPVLDTANQTLADNKIGSLVIGLFNSTPPTIESAMISSLVVGAANPAAGLTFEVDYRDNVGLDLSSLGASNLIYRQRGGSGVISATYGGSQPNGTDTYQRAMYNVSPPGPALQWDKSNEGIYDLRLGSSPVRNWAGLPVAALPYPGVITVDFTPPSVTITTPNVKAVDHAEIGLTVTDPLSGFADGAALYDLELSPIPDVFQAFMGPVSGNLFAMPVAGTSTPDASGSFAAAYRLIVPSDVLPGDYQLLGSPVPDKAGNIWPDDHMIGVLHLVGDPPLAGNTLSNADALRDILNFAPGVGPNNTNCMVGTETPAAGAAARVLSAAADAALAPTVNAPSDAAFDQTFNLPATAAFLSLDYRFTQLGDGDRLVISVAGQQVFDFLGTDFVGTDFRSTGPIDIKRFAGKPANIEVRLATTGQPDSQIQVANLMIKAVTPDLAAGHLSGAPSDIVAGKAFAITRTYAVSGSNVQNDFTIQYRLSRDKAWSNDDLALGSEAIHPAAGKSIGTHSGKATLKVPAAAQGTYYLLARLNSTSSVFESNDANNVIVGSRITVLAPAIAVLAGSKKVNIANGQTAPINFGALRVGAKPPVWVFTVKNAGTAPLTLGPVHLPKGYKLIDALASSLAPGKTDTFTVELLTTHAGTYSGRISFTTNDADKNPFGFLLTGRVI